MMCVGVFLSSASGLSPPLPPHTFSGTVCDVSAASAAALWALCALAMGNIPVQTALVSSTSLLSFAAALAAYGVVCVRVCLCMTGMLRAQCHACSFSTVKALVCWVFFRRTIAL